MPSKDDKLKSLVSEISSDEEGLTDEEISEKLAYDMQNSESLATSSNNEDPELNALANMMSNMKKPQYSNSDDKDMKYLKDLQAKAGMGRNAMANGTGSFRR